MDKSTDQMTFMDEERVILVDRDDNIIGSATKRVRLIRIVHLLIMSMQITYHHFRIISTPPLKRDIRRATS